ncbi:unnamed protein product [Linum tenue]|uniref:F-box domain-containing protein n=1 Tax=Linum tenue TaxID=586396 RepID=A0AAV0IIW1_9ROSI|nr:unnamed protein product [Linum tenue]
MDDKTKWATHVLAVFLFLLTALTSPVSTIRQVVNIVIFAFSSWRRNTQIKIEGEEKGLILFKPAVDELPGELLVEILIRLPARDLLRLKSVCRSWNATISSPYLVSLHLRNYTNGPAGAASQFLMVREAPYFDDYTRIKLLSPDHHGDHVSSKVLESEMPIVSGPCNGIFLMAHSKTKDFVRLWNPATGKSREISVPPAPRKRTGFHYYDSYGFGLDPAANDFKIVMIRHYSQTYMDTSSVFLARSTPEVSATVVVYTPGTGTWRELEELRFELYLLHLWQSYNYLNGFCFWLCISPAAALAFDLENEVFRVVNDPVPINCTMYAQGHCKQLHVYKDALAFFLFRESTGGYDLWLLSEEWCWVKNSTVAPFIPPAVKTDVAAVIVAATCADEWNREEPFMFAVGWWRDDVLVLARGFGGSRIHELLLFDPATQAIKLVSDDICAARRVLVYKESLVNVGQATKNTVYEEAPLPAVITQSELQGLLENGYNGGDQVDGLSDDGSQVGKKRRLNMEQVKTSEKNYELGNKLEPEGGMQLVRALGLQPRQIAIWFQNRGAWWETMQVPCFVLMAEISPHSPYIVSIVVYSA